MIVYFADRHFKHLLNSANWDLFVVEDNKIDEIGAGGSSINIRLRYREKIQQTVMEASKPGNYLLINSKRGQFFMTIIDRNTDSLNLEVDIYAEEAGLDLLNEIALPYEATEPKPISFYINAFTPDSGFEIGVNEIADRSRKLVFDGESTCLERILSVATQFDAELKFSFDFKGLDVIRKKIDIYQKIGRDATVELRLDRDIHQIREKSSIADMFTALYVTGGTPENSDNPINLVGLAYDDGDIHLDRAWLKSRKALSNYTRYLYKNEAGTGTGHIMGTFSYDTLSKQELLNRAITHLKKVCEPTINYEIDVKKLPASVEVGDRIRIVDRAGELYLESRILRLEYSETDDKIELTLGEHELMRSGIYQGLRDLAAQISENEKNQPKPTYTWIAYADSSAGSSPSLTDNSKPYVGIATNMPNKEPDLTDISVFAWTKASITESDKADVQLFLASDFEEAGKTATDFIEQKSDGSVEITNQTTTNGSVKAVIGESSFDILDGNNEVLASYGGQFAKVGKTTGKVQIGTTVIERVTEEHYGSLTSISNGDGNGPLVLTNEHFDQNNVDWPYGIIVNKTNVVVEPARREVEGQMTNGEIRLAGDVVIDGTITNTLLNLLAGGSGQVGSALTFKQTDENLTYGCWNCGLYVYKGYSVGAPDDWAGLMLVLPRPDGQTGLVKFAFTYDGKIYSMRQSANGTISKAWTLV